MMQGSRVDVARGVRGVGLGIHVEVDVDRGGPPPSYPPGVGGRGQDPPRGKVGGWRGGNLDRHLLLDGGLLGVDVAGWRWEGDGVVLQELSLVVVVVVVRMMAGRGRRRLDHGQRRGNATARAQLGLDLLLRGELFRATLWAELGLAAADGTQSAAVRELKLAQDVVDV